jgi:hypothetical protein
MKGSQDHDYGTADSVKVWQSQSELSSNGDTTRITWEVLRSEVGCGTPEYSGVENDYGVARTNEVQYHKTTKMLRDGS